MSDYRWYDLGNGRQVYRRIREPSPNRSDIQAPAFISDQFPDPVRSMADGNWYESKSALRRTYREDGNPQGKTYIEVGNEDTTRYEKPKRDKAKAYEAIKRADADIAAGRAPPVNSRLADGHDHLI